MVPGGWIPLSFHLMSPTGPNFHFSSSSWNNFIVSWVFSCWREAEGQRSRLLFRLVGGIWVWKEKNCFHFHLWFLPIVTCISFSCVCRKTEKKQNFLLHHRWLSYVPKNRKIINSPFLSIVFSCRVLEAWRWAAAAWMRRSDWGPGWEDPWAGHPHASRSSSLFSQHTGLQKHWILIQTSTEY